jgi:hypothetical protein
MHDNATIIGTCHVELFDADGALKDERLIENLIVTIGKNGIMDQLVAAPTIGKPTHMAIGTGTNAAAAGDTTLQTETARVALTSKTRSTNVVTMVGDYAAGTGTGAVTEAGILDAASVGNLFSRAVFAAVNKAAGDTLKVTWTYTGS